MKLARLRSSALALLFAGLAWSSGCALQKPAIDPSFAARTYTPARIGILPPNIFMKLDLAGDNDPALSEHLRQQVTPEAVQAVVEGLKARGYNVDLSARWDGVHGGDGTLLISAQDLAWLSSAVAGFAASDEGGQAGVMKQPAFINPELAARVGWATQSDALFQISLNGTVVSPGKRAWQVVGILIIVLIIVGTVLLASQGGGGKGSPVASRGMQRGGTPMAGGVSGAAPARVLPAAGGAVPARAIPPSGRGFAPSGGRGHYYGGGPSFDVGVGVVIPIGGGGPGYDRGPPPAPSPPPDDDSIFAGDQVEVALTIFSAQDGRVLWHVRDSVDVNASHPPEVQGMLRHFLDTLPPSLAPASPPTP